MNALLDKSFGGSSLLLVTAAVFSLLYPQSEGYKVVPHPVNQSGSSSKQISDLDIFNHDDTPFLAIELKDKPFTEGEVVKAAKAAFDHNVPSMLFIAGRSSALTSEVYRYFNDAKKEYEDKGMMIGVVAVDALLDFFFCTNYNANTPFVFELLDETMESTQATPEVMRWVYSRIEDL